MRECPMCKSNRVYKCSKLNNKTGYIDIWYGCMQCSYISEEEVSDSERGISLMIIWNDITS